MLQNLNITSLIISILLLPIGWFIRWLIKWFVKRNREYGDIIKAFKEKLPSSDKKAKKITKEELDNSIFAGTDMLYFNTLNLNTHEIRMPGNEIDIFFNKINSFNYKGVIFHKHYKSITENLNRFSNAEAINGNFSIVLIQEFLEKHAKVDFLEILWDKIALAWRFRIIKNKFNLYMYNKTKNAKWII